ncbi:MAG: TGS domain-containing protein [Planctomycetaceae bacterium]
MPANLTPQYHRAERELRQAQTAVEQLQCLQRMLQLLPKHKGTDKLHAELKARISDTRRAVEVEANAARSRTELRIPRQGAGRIVIVGAPNCGKSRLVKELTGADPEVADFPFTTRTPMPAMMDVDGVQVQLVDTPPIVPGQLSPPMLNLVRTSDAAALLFDGSSDDAVSQTVDVVQQLRNRKTCMSRHGGFNQHGVGDVAVPTLLVVTHANAPDAGLRLELLRECRELDLPDISVDFENPSAGQPLKSELFALLGLIRVFTKRPGEQPERNDPLTIPDGGTVEDLALRIHEDLAAGVRFAKVWGLSGHDGQVVGREYVLSDGDVVELHS